MDIPIGLVLAGGKGSRMGLDKGALRVGGSALAHRAAVTLGRVCSDVLVSVAPGAANPAPGYLAIEDHAPAGRGPLAGILAAFRGTVERDLLVLACDYPAVDSRFLRNLLSCARIGDAVVLPQDSRGRDHPLVALWRRETEAPVRAAIEARRYRVGAVVRSLCVRRVGARELGRTDLDRVLINLNRPSDLEQWDRKERD
jgi:molybdopterin-guanine dinucleotide biosynthesis protein A